jgi:DNA-binding response OmpR family regulator
MESEARMSGDVEKEAPLILVADDDEHILALIVVGLERSGYAVATADDGERALALARERRPQLAILDVTMPRLTGYEVTERLRDDEGTRRIPVILLTARVEESDVARGSAAGADDYVTKPFSPRELRARVDAVLARPTRRS